MLPELKVENGAVSAKLVESALAALNTASINDQQKILLWLIEHHGLVQKKVWARFYAFLLHRLHGTGPLNDLAHLVALITTPDNVSQGRINMVASFYALNASPALRDLLQAMRAVVSDPTLYVPSTGQSSVLMAKLPAKVVYRLCCGNTMDLSQANTEIKRELTRDAVETILGCAPLAAVSGTVPLAIEEFIYKVLLNWKGDPNLVILSVLPLFQYWPKHPPSVLRTKIFKQLEKSNSRSAASILPQLHWFGSQAEPTVRKLVSKLDSPSDLVYAVQYYILTATQPPPELVRLFIYSLPAGLAMCRQWAATVPDVCLILQGLSDFSVDLLPEDQFVLVNTPWIGSFAADTFLRLYGQQPPPLLTEETLRNVNAELGTFCNELVNAMSDHGFFIEPFLFYVQQ